MNAKELVLEKEMDAHAPHSFNLHLLSHGFLSLRPRNSPHSR